MNTSIECYPCIVQQIVSTSLRFQTSQSEQERMVKHILRMLPELDLNQPSPVLVTYIQRAICKWLKDDDPYREIKYAGNSAAMEWYPELKQLISESEDPFAAAVRISIAGNIIDYGIKGHVDPEEVNRCVRQSLDADIDPAEIERLRERVESANSILYLADNAGEIALDRLLIEQLPMEKVTLVVKGRPTLNDATMVDARQVGLTELVRVVDNGADVPGTVVEFCNDEFRGLFETADLVISKGQGNFETLCEESREISFLFLLKCPMVARSVNCEEGSFMVLNR